MWLHKLNFHRKSNISSSVENRIHKNTCTLNNVAVFPSLNTTRGCCGSVKLSNTSSGDPTSSVYIKVQEVVTSQSWKDILTHLIHCNEVKFEVSTCGLNLVDWYFGRRGAAKFYEQSVTQNDSYKQTSPVRLHGFLWFYIAGVIDLV